ncbi:DNA-binding transcriptional MocR family regulator [Cupriavidus gilardii J11]|uniref:DNA-binding transcriptional MocR family regulator n=1 Tax=Cupriavidus gilardii J11 TaxID=936133 RepID=A0A562B2K3_9BURK|nr:PLP-dependent aminotransferase family protein [Cupriavidus gilardii]TWG79238.1 DNA-binding transcriptional MocR family regulator [Cupriavidus gilardii J11]
MDALPLYRQLATHYRHAIAAGTLLPGDRLPSVRVLMERHRVSLSTALQACREMEAQGLVEARPRSGYFVRVPRRPTTPIEEPSAGLPDPAQYVGIHARISAIIARGLRHADAVNFAGACAPAELYPVDALRQAASRALRRHPTLLASSVEPEGHPALRAALARHALQARMALSPEQIVITHGCTEALNLALRAVAGPGDVIAVESPTYYGLLQILESLGMRALEVPTSPQTGISLEALELAAQTYDNIRAVVAVPNLQNPQGSIMPDANKARLVQWCETRGIALIEDDCFSALAEVDTPLAAAKAWDRSGNVIHCGSLHKILAPGMRLGWITAGRWQQRVEMLKFSQSRPNELLSQIAAADVMASGNFERHLRRLRQKLRDQREWAARTIATMFPAGTRLSSPRGGMHLWVELPGRLSSEAVFDEALRAGIRVMPGVVFSNSSRFDHCIRINTGAPRSAALEQAFARLAVVVNRLADR